MSLFGNSRGEHIGLTSSSLSGLVEPSARQRRHSAEDSATGSFNRSPKAADELTETRNADQLKNLVRDQQKLIHQLQMRVRLNIAEDVQSEAVEKLNEQVKVTELISN